MANGAGRCLGEAEVQRKGRMRGRELWVEDSNRGLSELLGKALTESVANDNATMGQQLVHILNHHSQLGDTSSVSMTSYTSMPSKTASSPLPVGGAAMRRVKLSICKSLHSCTLAVSHARWLLPCAFPGGSLPSSRNLQE